MTDPGLTAGRIHINGATKVALHVMSAITFYNVLELYFLIVATFKRYRGLYFYSVVVASTGCFLHGFGFLMKFFHWTSAYPSVAVITVGWYSMVTGQSVVLFSRLHLVEMNAALRRKLLIMIITDAVLLHVPTTVLTFGSNSQPSTAAHFTPGYKIMEKIQMSVFCVQELVLSGVYIRATLRRLRSCSSEGKTRLLRHLVAMNIIVICLDLVLLGIAYANLYDVEVILKSMIYSIKLKVEFSILGQLVDLARMTQHDKLYIKDNHAHRQSHRLRPFASPQSMSTAWTTTDEVLQGPTIVKTTEVKLQWMEDDKERLRRMSPGTSTTCTGVAL